MARLLDASGWFGFGAGGWLGLAGLTIISVAALHVGAERLLAGFDALSGGRTRSSCRRVGGFVLHGKVFHAGLSRLRVSWRVSSSQVE